MTKTRQEVFKGIDCEVRCDELARQLYATDASIYQIEPAAVAFPRSAGQTAAVMKRAADASLSITPRGAGTGLAGGALGKGLIVDLARYNRRILEFDRQAQVIRVQPGVILDQLNAYLRPHGLCFGPDVATSSRATLGGMISNNSSGARAPLYGTTIDHVVSLEVVLPDGTVAEIGFNHDALPEQRAAVERVADREEERIRATFHKGIIKRWPGYALEKYLDAPGDLTQIVCGSEGTLAAIFSAWLRVVPLPKEKGLGLLFFSSIAEAMEATRGLLDLEPAAIEHVDRVLFDQTKGQLAFQHARDMLELDAKPVESVLMVEFYEDARDKLAALAERRFGERTFTTLDADKMQQVWDVRKAGVSLLTGRKGPAKPIAGLEDVAVAPERLADYVAELRSLMEPLGVEGSFYGHVASGLLHVRPVLDLHKADDIETLHRLATDVFALARKFDASIAGEHGVGIARAEFVEEHLGPELVAGLKEIKAAFDPHGLMNPGKVFWDGESRINTNLRLGAGHAIPVPFETVLAFAAKDESFVANLEQCNGCGGCTKLEPTMCPTYLATGDEIMSTRGRANVIRAVLEGRLDADGAPLLSAGLDEALSNCISCKACSIECPSNVDLALLKAELVHARHQKHGISLLERLVSRVDVLGALGCLTPRLANMALRQPLVRKLMEAVVGLTAKRPLPAYATQRFDRWFIKRKNGKPASRGKVVLWDDCFVRYYEPNIGMAAVRVLETAGFKVVLPEGRACCGRPAFSMGRLDVAKRFGERNVASFVEHGGDEPIIFLEPSCYAMFAKDYAELKIDGAEEVAERCALFDVFLDRLLEREPDALRFSGNPSPIAIHAHCHAKALTDANEIGARLAARIPHAGVQALNTGCCGMAGAFGALKDKYALSVAVGQHVVDQINALEKGTRVVACGTSCRQQITHLTDAKPLHMAELIEASLAAPERPERDSRHFTGQA